MAPKTEKFYKLLQKDQIILNQKTEVVMIKIHPNKPHLETTTNTELYLNSLKIKHIHTPTYTYACTHSQTHIHT